MAETEATTKKDRNYTPQQIDFAMRYYLPNSPTYGNALQSALKAGYSESYAKNITVEIERANLKWIGEVIQEITGKPTDKKNLVAKAKKVLNKSLDSNDDKLAQDTAKFIAKSTTEFSEKQDITTGGDKLTVALTEYIDGGDKKDKS